MEAGRIVEEGTRAELLEKGRPVRRAAGRGEPCRMSDAGPVISRLLSLARPYRGWMLLAGGIACLTILASVALMAVAGWFIAAMAIAGVTTGMMNYFLPAAAIRLFRHPADRRALFRAAGEP
ncbi:hypothetical protein ACFSKM_22990 [Ancylobacter dichloromethanicus]